jgi:hypothetical protein
VTSRFRTSVLHATAPLSAGTECWLAFSPVRSRESHSSRLAATCESFIAFYSRAGICLRAACAADRLFQCRRSPARSVIGASAGIRGARRLGSGQSRLVWPVLTEGLPLSGLGAIPGVAIAALAIRCFRVVNPNELSAAPGRDGQTGRNRVLPRAVRLPRRSFSACFPL